MLHTHPAGMHVLLRLSNSGCILIINSTGPAPITVVLPCSRDSVNKYQILTNHRKAKQSKNTQIYAPSSDLIENEEEGLLPVSHLSTCPW